MHKTKLKLETVTPIFLHGHDNTILELRPPPFKALFRYWWRTVQDCSWKALQKEESKLFGSADGKAPFSIRISVSKEPDRTKYEFLPHKHGKKMWTFDIEQPFELSFITKTKAVASDYQQIAKLGFLLGGIGARSRRGFGSIRETAWNFSDIPSLRQEILDTLNTVAKPNRFQINSAFQISGRTVEIIESKRRTHHPPEYPVIQRVFFGELIGDMDNLLKGIGQATSDAKYHNKDDTLGGGVPRMASPVIVRIQKLNTQYLPIVRFSPEPLILSILAIKSERVGLLYTEQTGKLLDRIRDETELELHQLSYHKIDGSSTLEVYEKIMRLYKEWGHPENIAVDITGGKNSMVGGAAMAGAALGADIFYVDNTKFTHGKPEPGTEYLSLLDNPYTVFGDLEVEKAKSLYEVHDYASAQRIFNQLEGKGDPNQNKVYEAYEYLCTAYEDWDNLETGKAGSVLDELLKILTTYSKYDGLRQLCDYQDSLKNQRKALRHLQRFIKKPQLALQSPNGFHFAFTLYHNALRREAQGKLEMACLILYRLLEWIEQHRLNGYCINTKNPNYSNSCRTKNELLCLYNKKRKEIYPKNADGSETQDLPDLPSKIALVDGFLILEALGDKVVEGLDWGKFRNEVDTRNQSIFAHGMKKIEKKDHHAFKSTVEERFKKAQEIANIDADEFNKQHEFIVLLP